MKAILFSGPMVRAILAGNKTMTRRVIKLPKWATGEIEDDGGDGVVVVCENTGCMANILPPYKAGSILWVRETWRPVNAKHPQSAIDYAADWSPAHFKNSRLPTSCNGGKWRPSIFMPFDACRIFLRVKSVRPDRLQDISKEDAIAEGFAGVPCNHPVWRYACEDCMNTGWLEPPWVGFMEIWEKLNAKRGYAWETNPWVWVIEFERCDKDGNHV
jgi:hypothetical protein